MKSTGVLLLICVLLSMCSCSHVTEFEENYSDYSNTISETNSTVTKDATINNDNNMSSKSNLYYEDKMLMVIIDESYNSFELPSNIHTVEELHIDNLKEIECNLSFLTKLNGIKKIYINGYIEDLSFIQNFNELELICFEHYSGEISSSILNAVKNELVITNSTIKIICDKYWHLPQSMYINDSEILLIDENIDASDLKMFSLVYGVFNDNDLSFVDTAVNLTEFTYSPLKNIDIVNYSKLSNCNNLVYLSLSGDIYDLDFISELNSLENLTIISETYLDISSLVNANHLEYVAISCIDYDDAVLDFLIDNYPNCNWNINKYDKIFN